MLKVHRSMQLVARSFTVYNNRVYTSLYVNNQILPACWNLVSSHTFGDPCMLKSSPTATRLIDKHNEMSG